MGQCNRTGGCCRFILLDYSPEEIQKAYEEWIKETTGRRQIQDIHLIYPMLAGRYRGVLDRDGIKKHVYGPCKNLEQKDGIAFCSIHENRPRMCSGYPHYESKREVFMSATPPQENPGYMRGCGYNSNPDSGWSEEEILNNLEK